MPYHSQNLVWIDLEMTGLDPQRDAIIEIATVVTDQELNILANGPVLAVHQNESALACMDDWNQRQHGKSGLLERVRASRENESSAERKTLDFLSRWVPQGASPMCGNSICQDRRFLARCMPSLEAHFHYRNLDVSSIKILVQRWAPHLADGFRKSSSHEALEDILESIAELKYYRQVFLRY
ncbi:oligoribonuclease [Methylotetracoccus oryzae]|uniref:oligoribonuclease n=1 Tax=Methylotetracoccus oryzae TaxID=1919059 RepID=UPI00111ADB16|nr:oligoribonuclease [Methylotetracoccus oryzae]